MTQRLPAYPAVDAADVAWITADQMRSVDRVAVGFGLDLVQMMELAGDRMARLVLSLSDPSPVTVLAGTGGNGGGGMAAARHLANHGVDVTVVLADRKLSPAARHQCRLLQSMGIRIRRGTDGADRERRGVVVDALVGYSLSGPLRAPLAGLVAAETGAATDVYALDVPSGLDPDSGRYDSATVRADVTLTLALPKLGLRAADHTGDLYLADIGIPGAVYRQLGIGPIPAFRAAPILRVDRTPGSAPAAGDAGGVR